MKYGRTFYYSTEEDEVVNFKSKQKIIDENYKYIHKNPLYNLISFLTYKLIATPFAFITFKIIKNIKFHNTEVLKQYKKCGYFIYANHTNQFCDGFCPGLICFPKKPHLIVNPTNISLPFIGKLNQMWGALPIPTKFTATKNFYFSIENILRKNQPIIIYPEAHLWPYYTRIRNFPATSFRFPVKYNKPVFTFTTVYTKRKHSKKPKTEIYVDGPFFAKKDLPEKLSQQELKETIYKTLKSRAKLSNYEYANYKRRKND